jgi:ser-asp rich fibrinogen-binding, bone sialoprotein-binding protein
MEDVILTDKLPDEVQLKSVETIYSDGTKSTDVSVNENGEMEVNLSLGELTTANVKVEVMAKSLTKDTTITNKGKITHDKIGEIESNSITHVVELFDKNNVDPDKPSYTKKITGTVWIDKNRNGAKDADEEKVPNVTAILIDQNGNIVKNEKKSECVTTTDSDGNYLFNNLYSGTYTVVFLYESSLYSATTYRKDGVDESLNSDAIDKTIVFEGVQRIAGVTEIIKVTTFNVYNMDLGLVENTKFDLRLDKTVKVITTNNGKDVAEHTYNSKNAKIDFETKYITQSSMVVEYSITITNEGGVAGYAKKIADYIPTELKFNSELNKDWYEGANGTVYNSSLANTVINPGESKTVTLILTKNMNNDDFGVFSNSAEIYEASNNNGLLDIDSTPGNKASNEDDYSIANVIVGVKTGQAVIYVTLTMAVLIIIATGVYVIRKKVLK